MFTSTSGRLSFPRAPEDRAPSPWWYFGRAVYVSRRDYAHIFQAFVLTGALAGVAVLPLGVRAALIAVGAVAAIGFALLGFSLVGLWRMYGRPSRGYFRQLLELAVLPANPTIADVHIGTFRTAFALVQEVPGATVRSIDAWPGFSGAHPTELAVGDVRALEPAPVRHPAISAHSTTARTCGTTSSSARSSTT